MVSVFGVPAWRSRSFWDGWRWYGGELGQTSQVLNGCRQEELVVGAGEPPEPEALEAHVALEMGEQHLHFLAFAPGGLERFRTGQRPGVIAGMFVNITWNLALRRIGAAPGLQGTGAAVVGAGQIAERVV